MKWYYVLILVPFLSGCGEEKESCVFVPDVSGTPLALTFEQFEDSLVHISGKQELIALLSRQPVLRDEMLRRAEYPDDSVFVDEIFKRYTNPYLDTLLAETRAVFGDLSALKSQFREAFENIRYYYPDFEPPKIQTLVTGLDTDLFVSDSLVVVSLDFFLGPEARYRPKTYDYLMRRYDPEDIVTSVLLMYGISPRFNKTDLSDKTVLADMVAYGKSFYFAKHMLPCTPDSVFIWYTAEEITGARRFEDLIWTRLIQDKILFSTSLVDKKNYLGDRPVTTQVGEKCPGRIGHWVGWQVVNAFMEHHPSVTLPDLMQRSDARALFQQSQYKPRSDKSI